VRTTLTLEPDVARKLKRRMASRKPTLKDVVNQALCAGLDIEPDRRRVTFRVEPHPLGFKRGVDLDKLGQMTDELEAEEFARKFRA
jgi:hypothetical protein